MQFRFEARHKVALALGLLVLAIDFVSLGGSPLFLPVIAIALSIAWAPQWADILAENRRQKELESRFPEFVRNLTGAIKSGMPASQAVVHVSSADYGALSPYVKKLANQLEWSIPFHKAFVGFAKETRNVVIRRAVQTVIQAEQAGGNIEDVLISITDSLVEIKKIREQRKSSIHAQIIQSYIIFFVFIGVMVIIQNLLIPYMTQFSGGVDSVGGDLTSGIAEKVDISFSSPGLFLTTLFQWFVSLQGIFMMLALIQGFFAGAVLGKLAEGDVTSGLRHSLFMVTAAFIIMSLAQGFTA